MLKPTTCVFALGLIATPVFAQSPGMLPPAGAAGTLSPGDQAFVQKAAQGGMVEVQAGQLALQKSQTDGVKQFAQRMVDDHTKADDTLTKLVSTKGLTPPAEPSPAQQREYSMLEAASGPKFDRAYIRGQVKGHQAMLKLMQHEASAGKDPDLKAFAQSTTPTVQEHLQMAQGLQTGGK